MQSDDSESRDVPARVCPHCSALSQTDGAYCPHCGESYVGRPQPRTSRRVRLAIGGLVALVILGGAGAAVAIKLHHDEVVKNRHRREAAAAAAVKAAAERTAREKQTAERAEIAEREGLEKRLEEAITKEASEKVTEGTLTGPIKSTTCTPINGGSSQNLSESTGTYSCIAVNKTEANGTESGYRYTGTINFTTGSTTWHIGGEGG